MKVVWVIAVGLVAAFLSGCAVKPLKAPCARDEGPRIVPMAYSSLAPKAADECGPMKPVNGPTGHAAKTKGHVGPASGGGPLSKGHVAP